MQKAQDLLTAWDGEKSPVHGSYEEMRFANVVNDNNGDRGAADEGNTQASDGRASHSGATETRWC